MIRPIKFRGVRCKGLDKGTFVFGSYKIDGKSGETFIWHDNGRFGVQVYPESVAQLVGCDCDGREVYEGDMFVVPCGTEIAARFINNLTPNAKLKAALVSNIGGKLVTL